MPKMLPGEALIYERVDGVVFARYRDRPEIDRWVVGGDSDAISRLQGDLFNWSEWQDLQQLAITNITIRNQLDKLKDLYYLVKDNK